MRLFALWRLTGSAHENHEQRIIVSSRVNLKRMRMMPVILKYDGNQQLFVLPREEYQRWRMNYCMMTFVT